MFLEEQEPAGSERAAAGTTTTKKKKPDADVYEFDDEQEDADELCPIRISKLELRLPVVQEGAQLCTVSWKGEAAVKVVASTSLSQDVVFLNTRVWSDCFLCLRKIAAAPVAREVVVALFAWRVALCVVTSCRLAALPHQGKTQT